MADETHCIDDATAWHTHATMRVEIMLGSNTPDKKHNITCATTALRRFLSDAAVSPMLYCADFTGRGADYINRVVAGYIHPNELDTLTRYLKTLEDTLGRNRATPNVVAADLDLVTITVDGHTEIRAPREYRTSIFQTLRNQLKP